MKINNPNKYNYIYDQYSKKDTNPRPIKLYYIKNNGDIDSKVVPIYDKNRFIKFLKIIEGLENFNRFLVSNREKINKKHSYQFFRN